MLFITNISLTTFLTFLILGELLELKTLSTKIESALATSKNVDVKLTKILLVTEQKYWTNEQYLSSEGLEICSILESVNVNASENKIQGVLCGIDI